MLIFLIGMPGSGKTSIGKELAKLTGANLIDLDEYIAKKENLSIPQIFKTKGEDHFRKAETNCLKEIIERSKKTIGTRVSQSTNTSRHRADRRPLAGFRKLRARSEATLDGSEKGCGV